MYLPLCAKRPQRAPLYGLTLDRCKRLTQRLTSVGLFSLGMAHTATAAGTDGVLVQLAADQPQVVAQGEVVYQAQCAACHGVQLEGQPNWRQRSDTGLLPAPPHDASGHTWHHADDLLFEIVKYGPARVIGDPEYRSTMPAFEQRLSDADIIAVLSYIQQTWPEQERHWQATVNAQQTGQPAPTRPGSALDKLFK